MEKILLSLGMIFISVYSFSQENNPGCLDKTFPFFAPMDGFYVTNNCKFSEFDSYEFVIDRNSRSIKKEGVYREVWFRKKGNSNRHLSGTQILQNHADAIKAAGGEIVKESDGSVFKINYNGKEIWIYVNSNPYSADLDNYGIISIEAGTMNQEIGTKGTAGSTGTTAIPGPQGPQGVPGPRGPEGPAGPQGPAGPMGPRGQSGSASPKAASDSVRLSMLPGVTTPEQLVLQNIPFRQEEIEAIIPTRLLTAQGLPGPSGQPAPGFSVHTIGEQYGGGIVFYVYDNGQHGLIVAEDNLSPGLPWAASWLNVTLADGNGVGAGKINTAIIIGDVGLVLKDDKIVDYAAYFCNGYKTINEDNVLYGDWYLPSIWELYLLFLQKTVVPQLGSAYYWSSTEGSASQARPTGPFSAYAMSFLTGDLTLESKTVVHPFRPIRSF